MKGHKLVSTIGGSMTSGELVPYAYTLWAEKISLQSMSFSLRLTCKKHDCGKTAVRIWTRFGSVQFHTVKKNRQLWLQQLICNSCRCSSVVERGSATQWLPDLCSIKKLIDAELLHKELDLQFFQVCSWVAPAVEETQCLFIVAVVLVVDLSSLLQELCLV